MLFAVLEQHLAKLAGAIEAARDEHPCPTKERVAEALVSAYLREKMAQAEVSPALYRIAMELDAGALTEAAMQRSATAIEAMLASVADGRFDNPRLLAKTLTAALYGTLPAFCHRVLAPAVGREAERQLTIMFRSYLAAHQSGAGEARSSWQMAAPGAGLRDVGESQDALGGRHLIE